MKREIKFRGKDIITDEWIYGFPFIDNLGYECIIRKGVLEGMRSVHIGTIGQYTGLKDKNGTDIYEGDILGINEKAIGWVKGGVRGYCYDVVYIKHPSGEKDWSLYGTIEHDYPNKLEVIGNIYDNKELL